MKGKLLFVFGLGLGYVLGTRAGRRRYEQIKAAAQNIWESEPVQWGVQQAQDAVGDVADEVITRAKRVLHNVTGDKPAAKAKTSGARTSGTRSASSKPGGAKPKSAGSAATRPTPTKPQSEPNAGE